MDGESFKRLAQKRASSRTKEIGEIRFEVDRTLLFSVIRWNNLWDQESQEICRNSFVIFFVDFKVFIRLMKFTLIDRNKANSYMKQSLCIILLEANPKEKRKARIVTKGLMSFC